MLSIELSPLLEKNLKRYKETYQEFMGFSDEQMPKDDVLITIALVSDMDVMLKSMKSDK